MKNVNDLILVDVSGQYEFGVIVRIPNSETIAWVETISGGLVRVRIDELVLAADYHPGYRFAREWANELEKYWLLNRSLNAMVSKRAGKRIAKIAVTNTSVT